jgi:hypothetical protein
METTATDVRHHTLVTYTTLDGDVIDISTLNPEDWWFLDRAYRIFRQRGSWKQLSALVRGPENPVVGTGQRITRAVSEHPLYRAVRDLEDRLGILAGALGAEEGDEPAADPLSDELISVAAAAAAKGATEMAVRKAIARGDLIASNAGPRLMVSKLSLDRWTVNPARRAAGLRRGTARSA